MTTIPNAVMADNVARIRENMAQAARQAGRAPEEVLLCAVCKGHDADTIKQSAPLAVDLFGENRMQELMAHLEADAFGGKPCHFIGRLQSNKVRRVVGNVAVIESVGTPRLLRAINREAERQGIIQDILLQVNIGQEETKSGAAQEELWPLLALAEELEKVRVRGLMAIPPAFDNSPESRGWYAKMRVLFEQAQGRWPDNRDLDILSMGMTDSYQAAILEGATIIRVGRGIYGERP